MSLGEKVAQLRRARGMTQTELAEAAHVDQAIISRLERHKSFQVRSEVLKALATALGCTTDFLVGMHENTTSGQYPAAKALIRA